MSDNNKNSEDMAINDQEGENESANKLENKSENDFPGENDLAPESLDKVSSNPQQPLSIPAVKSKSKKINYQISLIDENILKVVVLTKKGVKIDSLIHERSSVTETQTNEIYLYPKPDSRVQEIEILISIDDKQQEEKIIEEEKGNNSEYSEPNVNETFSNDKLNNGNYQINLINENLLKIKVETEKGIRIDTIVREKKSLSESQSNKVYIKPKSNNEIQKVDITLEIQEDQKDDVINATKEGQLKLIPNPEVVDLIQPPDYSELISDSAENIYDTAEGLKNPFDAFKKLIRKNLVIGMIIAITLHSVAAAVVYFNLAKGSNEPEPEDQSRLIVIQDLPDPKIKLEDVEDPNKPKVQEIPPLTELEEPKRDITPRKTVRPPRVTRPETESEDQKKDTTLSSDLTRELDSLRRLVEANTSDTASLDTVKSAYDIPDSLRNNFNENDIGLAMYFPKNWKLTDQREINKEEIGFRGVLLTDTTAEQPGTMTLFIHLDTENKDYNSEDFKTEFQMNDSNLSAFLKEPKTVAGFTEYKFYIFNKLGTEKLSLHASVRKQFFDQYKNEIEAVVRSISIKKKEDL